MGTLITDQFNFDRQKIGGIGLSMDTGPALYF